jgi:hypothetical protein
MGVFISPTIFISVLLTHKLSNALFVGPQSSSGPHFTEMSAPPATRGSYDPPGVQCYGISASLTTTDDDQIMKKTSMDSANLANSRTRALIKDLSGSRDMQAVVVLVGIPGCGKTTMSTKVVSGTRWARVCQDELGNRKKVLIAAKELFASRDDADDRKAIGVVIDRCNFDADQRLHWVELAEAVGAVKLCVVLPDADDVTLCTSRATERGDDGVHTGKEDWSAIVARMGRNYVAPSASERFDGVYWCDSAAGGSVDEIVELLQSM